DMLGPIPSSVFQQDRYLPPSCAVTVEYIKQLPEFCLDAPTPEAGKTIAYKYEIQQAQLHVQMHTMSPKVVAMHNKMFQTKRAQFPLRNAFVRSTTLPAGSTSFTTQTMLSGDLSGEALTGTYTKDPFNLKTL